MVICSHEDCKTRASYGFIRGKLVVCKKHIEPGMIDLMNKKCQKCNKRPTFNYQGQTIGIRCKEHSEPGMIDVKNKKCLKCDKAPTFNHKGIKRAILCKDHAEPGMINVRDKTCEKCTKVPCFNYDEEKKGIRCVAHAEPGMVNVRDKHCEKCTKIPCFNYVGQTRPIRCKDHLEPDMVNVVSKKCQTCDKQPVFNYDGEKAGILCKEHSEPGMIDVLTKRCANDFCQIFMNPTYKPYCAFCFRNMFPNDVKVRNYMTKERAVRTFIQSSFPDEKWEFDKQVSGGCSKRRPDALLKLKKHVIIVEIDENQHINYDSTCENKRIAELYQDVDYNKIVFIRFNPDGYKTSTGKVASPWRISPKTRELSIMKTHETLWANRLNKLKRVIERHIKTIPEKAIQSIFMFYDQE